MCSMSASHLNSSDMAAYMINCIHQIQSTLAVYEFTDKHIEMLAGQTEAHLDTLISEQASFILTRSGIGSLYTVYQENRGQRVRCNSFVGVLSIELTQHLTDQKATSLRKVIVKSESPENLFGCFTT